MHLVQETEEELMEGYVMGKVVKAVQEMPEMDKAQQIEAVIE